MIASTSHLRNPVCSADHPLDVLLESPSPTRGDSYDRSSAIGRLCTK